MFDNFPPLYDILFSVIVILWGYVTYTLKRGLRRDDKWKDTIIAKIEEINARTETVRLDILSKETDFLREFALIKDLKTVEETVAAHTKQIAELETWQKLHV